MKRIISAILSMALLLSAIPFGALQVSAAADDFSVGQNGYVSDPSTIDSYKDYFTADSTEFAGAVWTDKSVFTKDNIGQNPFGITKDHAGHTLTDIKEIKNNEFLVSLSALSSTKQIEGYSYLPTDTILVLDLSGSMLNAGELDALLEAANKAIAELLNLNKHNRVGVVVYSNDGQEFFPLDRYTTTKRTTGSNAYDVYLEKNGNSQVRTARSGNTNVVKNSNGATMNKTYSLSSTGRTYIQSGLNVARNMFEGVEDITIPTGEIMGGTKRKPIVVLMSDGAPTRATASYTFANSSNPSYVTTNGYNSSDFHTFATQLTAAYVDREIGEHYDGECLFYTLGFNLENDVQRALSVLNPDSSTTAINNLWQAYQTATQNVTNIVSYGSGYNTTYLRRLEAAVMAWTATNPTLTNISLQKQQTTLSKLSTISLTRLSSSPNTILHLFPQVSTIWTAM